VRDSASNGTSDPFTRRDPRGAPSGAAVKSLANEVVQRLSKRAGEAAAGVSTEAEEVAQFCAALLDSNPDLVGNIARAALDSGLSFDRLCEERLAPAARRLGMLWERDELSFTEVTLAANRLFTVLRDLAHRPIPRDGAPFAVFAAPPGESHVLGVTMAAERARGMGWDVALLMGLSHDALLDRIAEAHPDVVGLSLSSRRALLPLGRLVVALRVAVPGVPVVVSGPAVSEFGEAILGADAMATGFDEALAAMARLAN
jgi:MerR family transcriptional regulator, light-induced transcriptional regulator